MVRCDKATSLSVLFKFILSERLSVSLGDQTLDYSLNS